MVAGLFRRDGLQLLCGQASKGATGRRQQNTLHALALPISAILLWQALEDGVVLAVNG